MKHLLKLHKRLQRFFHGGAEAETAAGLAAPPAAHRDPQLEDALRESNARYQLLFESANDAILLMDDVHFIDCNRKTLQMFGVNKEQIIGQTPHRFSPPDQPDGRDSQEKAAEMISRAAAGDAQLFEWRHKRYDGTLFDAEVSLNLFILHGKRYVQAIVRDITERKQAETALAGSEERYREILDTIEEGYYEVDLRGRFTFFNNSFCRITGYFREEVVKKDYREVFCNPDAVRAVFFRVYLSGQPEKRFTAELIRKDGSALFAAISITLIRDKRGIPTGFRGLFRDITEAKQAEDALRVSEERYREILASIEEGYYEVDLAGNLIFCNQAACRQIGYTRDELIGMNYRSLYKDPAAVYRVYNQVYQSGQPDRGFTLEMVRRDGSSVYGELSISLIRDKDGTVTGFRGVARDITERIQFEQKLKYLSLHDQLTGLYNRTYFEAEMQQLAENRVFPVTIISADLDGLKLINDTMGHKQGDRLLVECAGLLKRQLRGSDVLARVGGDEFAVILPHTDRATAEAICNGIRGAVEEYNRENPPVPLGISIGFATSPNPELSLDDTFKEADDIMYREKLYHSAGAHSQVINTLLAALAERDYLAEGHAARMRDLCLEIGQNIGLSAAQLTDLALLAQVHDLGKVGIPDRILFKNGSLSKNERESMQQHPEKGYRIARASRDLLPIADLILKHHERWDGNGYPMGLNGKQIPVECRILAIVDAYDAMINERPYSAALSREAALAEVERCAGSQFDPDLVPVFMQIIRKRQDLPE